MPTGPDGEVAFSPTELRMAIEVLKIGAEVTVALGVNATGKIGFLGTGAQMGGTASLTLTFKVT